MSYPLKIKDAELRLWHGRGLSDISIANKFGMCPSTVCNRRHRLGLVRKSNKIKSITEADFILLSSLVALRLTDKEIGKIIGISAAGVWWRRHLAGIKTLGTWSRRKKPPISAEDLFSQAIGARRFDDVRLNNGRNEVDQVFLV